MNKYTVRLILLLIAVEILFSACKASQKTDLDIEPVTELEAEEAICEFYSGKRR